MVGSMRAGVCGLLTGLLGWFLCGTALGQDAPGRPEVVPAPSPARVTPEDRPQPTYGPLQAGQDAYRMAEQQRRWAVERQAQLTAAAWGYGAWVVPYAPNVPQVYVYRPRRALRRAYRWGYLPAGEAWTWAPAGVYPYPYYPWVTQPPGYGQVWIGPGGYVYRPSYQRPDGSLKPVTPAVPSAPSPASPLIRPQEPTRVLPPDERRTGPALNPPIQSSPEPIPAPPAELPPG